MEDIHEFLWLYFSMLLPWPSAFAAYSEEMDLWGYFAGWILVGAAVAFPLSRLKRRFYMLAWITIWFMPGTIICGSAALVPWPMALYGSILGSECSTPLTVVLSLLFNALIVVAVWALLRHVKARARVPN